MPSGETIHYSYDGARDELVIQLREAPSTIASSPHPLSDRALVERDPASGETVAVRVRGIQAMILEAIVRDLVLGLRRAEDESRASATGAPSDTGVRATDAPDATATDASTRSSAPRQGSDTTATPRGGEAQSGGATDASSADPAPKGRKRRTKRVNADRAETTEDRSAPDPGSTKSKTERQPDTASAEPTTEDPSKREPTRSKPERHPDAAPAESKAEGRPEADPPGSTSEGPPDPAPAEATTEDPSKREPTRSKSDARPGPDPAKSTPGAVAAQREAGPDGPTPAPAAPPIAFSDLAVDARLGAAIADMGFDEPTPIQRRAVPEALTGRDVVGLAQTGTGKTLAFLLPGLQRILSDSDARHRPRLLVVTPTRELAVQVADEAQRLASRTDVRTTTVYGGASMRSQTSSLRKGTDVVVATPGRLLDHLRRGNVDLSQVEVVVLDEADRMLDMGFLPDVREILHNVPEDRQTLLFGATLPPPIESLSLQFQRDPVLVEVARQLPPESIVQKLYPVGKHLKLPLLVHLLTHDADLERVLVFTERRSEADMVARRLTDAGLEVAVMHGEIRQRERERSLRKLGEGAVQALVATNVAARGLDIEGVSHVVNYDVPQTVDEYIHRIGRTARADAKGTAYTFIAPGDQWMVKRIESALERELPRVEAEGFDYDVPTPSWAQPSPDDVARSLEKPASPAEISRRMRLR